MIPVYNTDGAGIGLGIEAEPRREAKARVHARIGIVEHVLVHGINGVPGFIVIFASAEIVAIEAQVAEAFAENPEAGRVVERPRRADGE